MLYSSFNFYKFRYQYSNLKPRLFTSFSRSLVYLVAAPQFNKAINTIAPMFTGSSLHTLNKPVSVVCYLYGLLYFMQIFPSGFPHHTFWNTFTVHSSCFNVEKSCTNAFYSLSGSTRLCPYYSSMRQLPHFA